MFFNTKNNKNALILTLFITTSSLTISAQVNKPSNRIHNPGTHFYLNDDPAPLHSAVQASDLKALQLLLKHGIDPDTEDKNGNTPLMVASALGKIEMIDLYCSPLRKLKSLGVSASLETYEKKETQQ